MSNVHSIIKSYTAWDKSNLIPILQQVQSDQGYISPEVITAISNHLHLSKSQIFGVASFYSQFKFNPPGRHSIKICLGTACHVQGGDFLLAALQSEIGIKTGETTDDGKFDLDRVACLGCCALAPVVMIDNIIHSRVSVIKLRDLLNSYE